MIVLFKTFYHIYTIMLEKSFFTFSVIIVIHVFIITWTQMHILNGIVYRYNDYDVIINIKLATHQFIYIYMNQFT